MPLYIMALNSNTDVKLRLKIYRLFIAIKDGYRDGNKKIYKPNYYISNWKCKLVQCKINYY